MEFKINFLLEWGINKDYFELKFESVEYNKSQKLIYRFGKQLKIEKSQFGIQFLANNHVMSQMI